MKQKRNRLALLALLVLFTLPMVAAHFVFKYREHFHFSHTNEGALITPPRPVPLSDFKQGKWTLLLYYPSQCDESCIDKLTVLKKINIAMGKNQNKVVRAILTDQRQNTITQYFPKVELIINNSDFAAKAGTTFIVDPNGLAILAYKPNAKPKAIFKDLKKLLKLNS